MIIRLMFCSSKTAGTIEQITCLPMVIEKETTKERKESTVACAYGGRGNLENEYVTAVE